MFLTCICSNRTRGILNGYPVYGFHQTQAIQSLCLLAGTKLSRYFFILQSIWVEWPHKNVFWQLDCRLSLIGLEPDKLPSEDQPLWTHRVSELCDCVTRWFFVCIWWKGRYGHAVGLKRGKTLVHPWWRWHSECPLFQSKQILAVCCSRTQHQGLGKLKSFVEKRIYRSLVMYYTVRKVIAFEIWQPSYQGFH